MEISLGGIPVAKDLSLRARILTHTHTPLFSTRVAQLLSAFMFSSPQDSYVEIIIPNVMVLGGRTLGSN